MAILPTVEEKARLVLDVFKQHNARSGHVLGKREFLIASAASGLPMNDFDDGIQYGRDQHWFEDGPNGSYKLTDAGFAAM